MKLPKYVRRKTAKGKSYLYFDTGLREGGRKVLTRLPDIRDPKFGGALAKAQAARSMRKDKRDILTFEKLVALFERSPKFMGLSEASKRSYTAYLTKASALLRDGAGRSAPAHLIERGDIANLHDKLAETPGAANQVVRAVGALYAWGIKSERVKKNPTLNIDLFPPNPHKPWPDTLLEEALNDPEVRLPVALFYFTGQRISDVIRMSWDDIKGDYMLVNVKKTKRPIRVAILPELAEILGEVERQGDTILVNSYGEPWKDNGLRIKLQAWAAERGHKVVPHGLRKNAVNSLLEAGCTPSEVHGITDQSIQMIEHYSKDINKLALGRAAMAKLQDAREQKRKVQTAEKTA